MNVINDRMMKNFTLLVTILLSLTAVAQDSPGKRPALLIDKTVKIKPIEKGILANQKGYDSFYADADMAKRYSENKSRKTTYEALANRIFQVTAVEPVVGQGNNYKIKLQDTIKDETVYFKFNEASERQGHYYFEVLGGLQYPPDFYCDFVQQESGNKTVAMITEGLTITKNGSGKGAKYTMEVRAVEQIISLLPGVTLTLDNGAQITKAGAEAQMVVSDNDNIVYTATFDLTPQEISLLGQSKVVSGKISKFGKVYAEGEKLRQMVRCLQKM